MDLRQPHCHGAHTARGICEARGLGHAGHIGRDGIFFRREPPRRDEQRPGGDDEGLARSGQRFAHGIDGALVDLAGFHEFREIVNEGEVDGAVGFARALAQAVEIVERPAMDLGAQLLERDRILVGAGQAQHFVPVRDQFLRCGGADEPGRAGDKHSHDNSPFSDRRDIAILFIRVK